MCLYCYHFFIHEAQSIARIQHWPNTNSPSSCSFPSLLLLSCFCCRCLFCYVALSLVSLFYFLFSAIIPTEVMASQLAVTLSTDGSDICRPHSKLLVANPPVMHNKPRNMASFLLRRPSSFLSTFPWAIFFQSKEMEPATIIGIIHYPFTLFLKDLYKSII